MKRSVRFVTFVAVAMLGAIVVPATAGGAQPSLLVSSSANRSGAVPLDGTTQTGNIYVFVAHVSGTTKVSFWLDDPTRTGAPRHVENGSPWDFAGGSSTAANPFDSGSLTPGSHTITAEVVVNGVASVSTATFTAGDGGGTPTVSLVVSTSANRSSPVPLADASLTGDAYVFTTPDTNVSKVSFWLDDPTRAGPPRHVENAAPFDFVGTSGSSALPWNTSPVAAGSHTITAEVVRSGVPVVVSATFTTGGGSPPPPPPSDATLRVSTSSSRTPSTLLQDAALSGNAYIFLVSPTTPTSVSFWIDDPNRAGPPSRVETGAPYDLAGGTSATANPIDTVLLSGGLHAVTAGVTTSAGTTYVTSTFSVSNPSGGGGPVNSYSFGALPQQTYSSSEAQGVVIGGNLFQFGGFDSTKSCCTPTNRSWMYDPAVRTWYALPAMPNSGVTHAGLATDGRRIWLVGGYVANSTGTSQIFATRQVWQFDTVTRAWSRIADLPVARGAGTAAFVDGSLHFFSGTNAERTMDTPEHWALQVDATTPAWVTRAAIPDPINHMGAVVFDGRIYTVGGQHGHDGKAVFSGVVQVYDPVTNSWPSVASPLPPLPLPRSHTASATFVMDGRIVVAGGQYRNANGTIVATSAVHAFDPLGKTWTALTPLPLARQSGVAGPLAQHRWLYTGGATRDGWLATPN